MVTSERTRRVAQTNFTVANIEYESNGKKKKMSMEDIINMGNAVALDGWWRAGEDCIALGMTPSAYGDKASKESRRASKNGRHYSSNTIRQMVGYVIRAIEQGDKRRDYDGLDQLRATMTQTSTKKGKVKEEPTGKRVVNASTRKAYDALIKTPEFRALPKYEQALIRKLAKGEAFHTNIG
jgi:hypothetical protein